MIQLGPQPRFLITRLSAIGDCVHTLPVVSALRGRFPEAEIAWVTQPAAASLLKGHPEIDRLILAPRDWCRSWTSARKVIGQLRERRIDVAIDPQGLTKSGLLARLSGARYRIGFTRPQARELSPWTANVHVEPRQSHVVERYLELLGPLGIGLPTAEFNLPIDAQAASRIDGALVASGVTDRFALLNPGAGWDSKVWPWERYGEVARRLWGEHRLPSVVLWAGEQEKAWAEQIVASAPGAARIAPDTTLVELAAICCRATFFVGSDTGPLHLAAAVGTPCVGMYGPTLPSVCGPYGAGHISLQAFYQGGNSRERRGADNRAMQAIDVEQVVTACGEILDRRREHCAA